MTTRWCGMHRYVWLWMVVAAFFAGMLALAGHERNRPSVVLFDRSLTGRHLFHDLADQAEIAAHADVIIVTRDGSRPVIETGGNGRRIWAYVRSGGCRFLWCSFDYE